MLFSVYGTPAWANGGKGMNVAPTQAIDLRNFALAAASRYSGTYMGADGQVAAGGEGMARVERAEQPGLPRAAVPQTATGWVIQSASDYARICNAIYNGVHATLAAERARRLRRNRAARATTTRPARGRPSRRSRSCARSKKAGLKTFDAWAHHPYYSAPSDTPTTKPVTAKGAPATAVTLGNLSDLIREVTQLYGNKRIWITEYGYQTNPPDPIFGVSYAKQAAYLTQAFGIARKNPRIDMMLWFLLKDEPTLGRLAVGPDHRRRREEAVVRGLPAPDAVVQRDRLAPPMADPLATWPGSERRDPPRRSSTWVVRAALAGWLRAQAAELERRAPVRVLDVGCGVKPYYPFFAGVASEYVGVDVVENPAAELLGSVEALPVEDASFDVVLCTQVLEHCDDPAQAVRELRRVTAPGGRVLASTHGVQVYHPSPVDYWRWTHEGLRRLFEQNATWSALRVEPGAGTASALAMLLGTFVEIALRRTVLARGRPSGC